MSANVQLVYGGSTKENLTSTSIPTQLGVEAGAKDWNEMRKHLFDNMGPYMARKEERIKAKGANISPPSNTTPEPPVKKSKLTCELLNQKKS